MSTDHFPPPCAPAIAKKLGLNGLTVFPIPKTNIASTVHKYAQERRRQLDERTSVEETLIFIGATTADVHTIEQAGKLPGRITFFGEDQGEGLLFFRMPRPTHEIAHNRLFLLIWEWVARMGLKKRCTPVAASKYDVIGGASKEGDSGIRPDPPREYGVSFPTLAIEAGNSQSYPQLLKDKDWWFDNSPPGAPRGDVKAVIIIKVYSQSRRILLELWHRGQQSASQSVTIKPNPQVTFSVEMDDWQTRWVVEGAPLKVGFVDVFLRPAEGQEGHFILDEQDLAELAIWCWRTDRKQH